MAGAESSETSHGPQRSSDPLRENERDVLKRIGTEVVRARERLELPDGSTGASQRQLAELVGTTQTSIRRLENGEANVSITVFVRTAKVLGLTDWDDLLGPIKPQLSLVKETYEERREEIEGRTAALGLGRITYFEQKSLLQLMGLWPR